MGVCFGWGWWRKDVTVGSLGQSTFSCLWKVIHMLSVLLKCLVLPMWTVLKSAGDQYNVPYCLVHSNIFLLAPSVFLMLLAGAAGAQQDFSGTDVFPVQSMPPACHYKTLGQVCLTCRASVSACACVCPWVPSQVCVCVCVCVFAHVRVHARVHMCALRVCPYDCVHAYVSGCVWACHLAKGNINAQLLIHKF